MVLCSISVLLWAVALSGLTLIQSQRVLPEPNIINSVISFLHFSTMNVPKVYLGLTIGLELLTSSSTPFTNALAVPLRS